MKRRGAHTLSAVMIAALLVACSSTTLVEQDLNFQLTPSHTLGYEVTAAGAIVIEQRGMSFSNASGQPAATVTGYTVRYFDGTGTERAADPDGDPYALDVFVPGGFTCTTPDPNRGCEIFDEGWRTGPGPVVQARSPGNLLPVSIASLQLADPNAETFARWYAEFTFHGTRSNGADFYTRPFRVDINPPD